MTLTEIIDLVAERQAQPFPLQYVPSAVALTPRGDAAIALYRFVRQLRALDAADREYILGMLTEELAEPEPLPS